MKVGFLPLENGQLAGGQVTACLTIRTAVWELRTAQVTVEPGESFVKVHFYSVYFVGGDNVDLKGIGRS